MDHGVDLRPIQEAVKTLITKYPYLSFGSDFEPAINGHRGIFDIHITKQEKNTDDLTILSIIVPQDLSTAGYVLRIEDFLRNKALIR